MSIHMPTHMSIHMSIHMSRKISRHMPAHMPIHWSGHMSRTYVYTHVWTHVHTHAYRHMSMRILIAAAAPLTHAAAGGAESTDGMGLVEIQVCLVPARRHGDAYTLIVYTPMGR